EITGVDDELVHRDPPDHGHPDASAQHTGFAYGDPRDPVGVPDRDEPDRGVPVRHEIVPVRNPFAGADPAYLGQLAHQPHRRPQPDAGLVDAVQAGADPDQVAVG